MLNSYEIHKMKTKNSKKDCRDIMEANSKFSRKYKKRKDTVGFI